MTDETTKQYPNALFESAEEQIDYMYGDDPALCEALKNCLED